VEGRKTSTLNAPSGITIWRSVEMRNLVADHGGIDLVERRCVALERQQGARRSGHLPEIVVEGVPTVTLTECGPPRALESAMALGSSSEWDSEKRGAESAHAMRGTGNWRLADRRRVIDHIGSPILDGFQ